MKLTSLFAKKDPKTNRSDVWIFGVMLGSAIAGLIAAFVLTVEKFHLLEDPNASLTCSFNLVLNCATVMQTPQAEIFGFPNSLIGLMGYAVVITVAVAALAGVRFGKRFLQTAQIGFGLGLIFAYWLFFQSVFVIQVLCPWCLVVTVVTTLIFECLLRYNLRENVFSVSKDMHKKVLDWLERDYDKLATAAWLFLMIVIVILKFRDGLLSFALLG